MIDPALGLRAGDVFTWDNFPLPDSDTIKRRWFIYLGNNTIQATLCTGRRIS